MKFRIRRIGYFFYTRPPVTWILRWLFPFGIQGERGGWKDDLIEDEDPQEKNNVSTRN